MAEVIAAAGSKTILAAEVVPEVITQYEPPACSLASASSLGGARRSQRPTEREGSGRSSGGLEVPGEVLASESEGEVVPSWMAVTALSVTLMLGSGDEECGWFHGRSSISKVLRASSSPCHGSLAIRSRLVMTRLGSTAVTMRARSEMERQAVISTMRTELSSPPIAAQQHSTDQGRKMPTTRRPPSLPTVGFERVTGERKEGRVELRRASVPAVSSSLRADTPTRSRGPPRRRHRPRRARTSAGE